VAQAASISKIRDAFFESASRSANSEVAYKDLFYDLLSRGWVIPGATIERQEEAVLGALNGDPRIKLVRPGVFTPAGD
jgi:hypothetical protein